MLCDARRGTYLLKGEALLGLLDQQPDREGTFVSVKGRGGERRREARERQERETREARERQKRGKTEARERHERGTREARERQEARGQRPEAREVTWS
jgi:hypothetical protein